MIHYQLRCGGGHDFEGWFRNSAAFEEQAKRGLLSCPQCGAVTVERALMAPSVRTSRGEPREPAASRAGAMLPDQMRAALQRLRAEVERHCDDVGDGFAEAARRLHQQEDSSGEPVRGIYGQASEAERDALSEEGIEIMRIPWLPRAES
jgi:hypothetical protein